MSIDPKPVAWTLQSELDASDSTCGAHLWFTNPRNTAWAPLYTRATLDAAIAQARRDALEAAAVEMKLVGYPDCARRLRALADKPAGEAP